MYYLSVRCYLSICDAFLIVLQIISFEVPPSLTVIVLYTHLRPIFLHNILILIFRPGKSLVSPQTQFSLFNNHGTLILSFQHKILKRLYTIYDMHSYVFCTLSNTLLHALDQLLRRMGFHSALSSR
jgi:hypothetical protein